MVQTLACFELYPIDTLNRTLLLLLLLYLHVDDNEGSRTIAGINNRRLRYCPLQNSLQQRYPQQTPWRQKPIFKPDIQSLLSSGE